MNEMLETSLPPTLAADQILTFAQADAVRAYGDLSEYCVRLSLEPDGWHVDYELRDARCKGGGPLLDFWSAYRRLSLADAAQELEMMSPRHHEK